MPLTREQVGEAINFLTENATCDVLTYGNEAVGVELPAAVVLEVAQTEPWVRGDTAQGGTKPAKLETGLTVQVPLFVNTGDKVKVDTRTGHLNHDLSSTFDQVASFSLEVLLQECQRAFGIFIQ
jgi:elongation factor P